MKPTIHDNPTIQELIDAGILVKKVLPFQTKGVSKRQEAINKIRGTNNSSGEIILKIRSNNVVMGHWHDEFPAYLLCNTVINSKYPEHDDFQFEAVNEEISESIIEKEAYTFKDHSTYTKFMHPKVTGVYSEEYKDQQREMHKERFHLQETINDQGETEITIYQVHESEEMPEMFCEPPVKKDVPEEEVVVGVNTNNAHPINVKPIEPAF